MQAYCFASGHINFGQKLPAGALPIAKGNAKSVQDLIEGTARLAYDNKTWLVPGVPEAPDQIAAVDALSAYVKWISERLPAGVSTIYSRADKRRAA